MVEDIGGKTMSCHETVSSDVPGSKDRSQTAAAGTDPNTPVSSELSAAAGQEADGDWVEDGWMMEMYGGGTLESVPDFDPARAMIEGFDPKVVEVEAQFSNLPRSCDLEYATPETVCGRDDRVRITSTTRIPWRAICQLIITGQSGGTSRCTGWFIGPRTVMTAGHCVYSHGGGGWAKKIEVIPGMDAASRPFGSQTGNSFRSVSAWTTGANPEYDYGAIILPDNSLGNKVGWFGFAALSDATLNQMLVTTPDTRETNRLERFGTTRGALRDSRRESSFTCSIPTADTAAAPSGERKGQSAMPWAYTPTAVVPTAPLESTARSSRTCAVGKRWVRRVS
jgi:V8-like Glu-specific endopeptidase